MNTKHQGRRMFKRSTLAPIAGRAGLRPGAFAADKPVYAVLMKTLNPFWGAMEKGGRGGRRQLEIFLDAVNPTKPRSRSSTPATPCCEEDPAMIPRRSIDHPLPCLKQANE